jgi:hypothetical protein
MKMERTECSETSTYKIQMPGNYPEENIEQTECSKTSAYKIQIPGNYPEENIEHSVPKRQHIKFRCREITQKET